VQWNSSRSLCWCVGVFALLCVMLVLRGVCEGGWLCGCVVCGFGVVFMRVAACLTVRGEACWCCGGGIY